jgi:hypothetical protein
MNPDQLDELERLAKACETWAAEMNRAASACEDVGASIQVIDGNRACAATLEKAGVAVLDLIAAARENAKLREQLRRAVRLLRDDDILEQGWLERADVFLAEVKLTDR